MPRLQKPWALRAGDTLGVAAPGFCADPELLDAGCALLEAAGFPTRRRDDIFERAGYLAGATRAGPAS